MKLDMMASADCEGRIGNLMIGVADYRLEDCKLVDCESGCQGRRTAAAECGPRKECERKRVSVGLLYRDYRRYRQVSLKYCRRDGVGLRWWMGPFEGSCNGDRFQFDVTASRSYHHSRV